MKRFMLLHFGFKQNPTRKRVAMKAIGVSALVMWLAPAPAIASPVEDVARDESPPTKGIHAMSQELLESLVGSWEGTCRTWFEPDKLADESGIKGTIRPVLEGRFIRHEYEGTIQGRPRHGEETIAYNAVTKRYQISWIDDFHMNYAIMFSEGEAMERGFVVAGHYDVAPDTPPWGWKTVYELVDEDHLTITAYNVTPDGQEVKAVETQYVRAGRPESR